MSLSDYEITVGLEIHAELLTATKIFCSCPTSFGALPNTHCCPVCMGLPGSLPTLNRRAVELAITAGLALGCEIARTSSFDRKHYFYPDLPKGYQISQDASPLCRNGSVRFLLPDGEHRVGIERIHMEEDAGKLTHAGEGTLVDANRCGIPLIEIVTRPELHSGIEAAAFFREVRNILLTAGVSDCRMQEGSLRCDVNLSLRKKGCNTLGVRTETKNLNSFHFVEKAVSYEAERQAALLDAGLPVEMETRRFDPASGKTVLLRKKERAADYRFLTEPDLPPLVLTEGEIGRLRCALPELPIDRATRLERRYAVSAEQARILVSEGPDPADYFEEAAGQTAYPNLLSNLFLSELWKDKRAEPFCPPIKAQRLAQVAELFGTGFINSSTAKQLLARLRANDFDPGETVRREELFQIRDPMALDRVIAECAAKNPRAVNDYRNGKTAAAKALLGQAMGATRGRADPVLLEARLNEFLKREEKEVPNP